LTSHGSNAIAGYHAGGATASHQGWTISFIPMRITIHANRNPIVTARIVSHL